MELLIINFAGLIVVYSIIVPIYLVLEWHIVFFFSALHCLLLIILRLLLSLSLLFLFWLWFNSKTL